MASSIQAARLIGALGRVGTVMALVGLTAGCGAVTERIEFGPLTPTDALFTMIVTRDPRLIERECPAPRDPDGCFVWREVRTPGGTTVRAVRMVRVADTLPSPATFEIHAHELCHAIAALQPIADPCHIGNNGVLHAQLVPRAPFDEP